MKTRKQAFVDYENTCGLFDIDINAYEKVFIFLGALQSKITFDRKMVLDSVNMTVIPVTEYGVNNLDFHLAFYLGISNQTAEKETIFEIISNDRGFRPLVNHINQTGRDCRIIEYETAKNSKKGIADLADYLASTPEHQHPKSRGAMRNFIATRLNIRNNDLAIEKHLQRLSGMGIFDTTESKFLTQTPQIHTTKNP